jgi:hypothetical protein
MAEENSIENINERVIRIEKKLDLILKLLEKDIKPNCTKMGSHIDFVEDVYDNVKNPLGFICNKVNYLSGNDDVYSLENTC